MKKFNKWKGCTDRITSSLKSPPASKIFDIGIKSPLMGANPKILMHLAAGNGDLINTTGVIELFHKTYPNIQIDFLCLRKQSYLIKNTIGINHILNFEDFPLVNHVVKTNYDSKINSLFKNKYDLIINMWQAEKRSGDFPLMKREILESFGFTLPSDRKLIRGVLRANHQDLVVVENFSSKIRKRKVALIEDDSITAKEYGISNLLEQIEHQKEINKFLMDNGWVTISNKLSSTYKCDSLNLIQIRFLFNYCDIFLGLGSGMTMAIFTEPTDYNDKTMWIAGSDQWNYTKYFNNSGRIFFSNTYDLTTFKRELRSCKH